MEERIVKKIALGEQIKKLREQNGWTQDRLSEESGVSKYTISLMEKDNTSIKAKNLVLVANAFDISLDYLVFGSERKSDVEEALEGFSLLQRSLLQEIFFMIMKIMRLEDSRLR